MPYSSIDYFGNGTTTAFSVPFPYLEKSHIEVKVNGVVVPTQWTGGSVYISPAPAGGATVHISRSTPRTPIVSWVSGAQLRPLDLNLAASQAIYICQELLDATNGLTLVPHHASHRIDGSDPVSITQAQVEGLLTILGSLQSQLDATQVTIQNNLKTNKDFAIAMALALG